MTQVTMKRA